MLAIISDLHLADESMSDNVNPDAFEKILLPTLIDHAGPRGAKGIPDPPGPGDSVSLLWTYSRSPARFFLQSGRANPVETCAFH